MSQIELEARHILFLAEEQGISTNKVLRQKEREFPMHHVFFQQIKHWLKENA
jgi:hypothetical protein